MRQLYLFSGFLFAFLVTATGSFAQSWPVSFDLSGGDRLKVYEPQPTRHNSGELVFQSAVAYYRNESGEPVFGTLWATAYTQEQGSYERFMRMTISALKFPAEIDEATTGRLSRDLEQAIPEQRVLFSIDQLKKGLELQQQKEKLAGDFNNKPPKLIYRDKPSLLVIVDGNPIWQKNENWGVEAVVNSPNTIVKSNGKIYIYGGNYWYSANRMDQSFTYTANPPSNLDRIAADVKANAEKSQEETDKSEFESEFDEDEYKGPVAEVLVSTEPAELIQSRGEASFSPISNTNLLYVENSPNELFMDVNSQQYYVLLSGRWYRAASLKGNWQYIPAEQLPQDFANIPVGSPKDNVLASVPNTPASRNALMDAELPQTAKVDRRTATASVDYDGDPEFQSIEGTRMDYAVNTNATVIRYKRRYYLVDNGVWFQSGAPNGPWVVSTVRPDEVDLIPARYPVYPVKYVYIYDVHPDFIYMGYTPGYLNTFVYGPTVVYGTGFYYRPWYRRYYYPRPFTWGFNMHYTPWYGWSIGFGFRTGWFNVGYGYHRPWNYWHGGWWGPSVYRPAYCAPRYRHYGYYGYRNNTLIVNNYYGNNYRNYRYNNVYHSRPAITTRDNRRYYGNNYSGNYNNRNNNDRYNGNTNPGVRPNRNYYGSNRDREYNNRNNTPNRNNEPGRVNPNRNNSYGNTNRPDRTYRPGNQGNTGNRPQNQPGQRAPITRPSGPERMERSGRPQISRNEPQQRRPEVRREAPSRPSGGNQGRPNGGGGQRSGGGNSRPERRGN
ncbi:hypothetical protein L0U88_00985 [Flavihumibacter sp. RY-1]|uniref:Carbohydrate-binding family V/XII n=1 Tax=Flavihumibacter fluminis TaxID=2909236 RepID=A0ABS9BDT1_9BACT|nr:hypothetical protein [Flavihumibacter fluminis]MCF1713198.1 hypothetical protein [Flavihumibacter fluminis]